MSKKMRKQLIRILVSILLIVVSLCLKVDILVNHILYVMVYLIVGYDIVLKTVRNILKGKIFDENFLMTIATLGAFGIGEFKEAAAVMLFYQIGELFQNYAVSQSRKSVSALMDIRPDSATIEKEGKMECVSPEEVMVGQIIFVRPGEKIPLDGIVVEGESFLNTFALTGESIPRKVTVKDEVLSGCINQDGVLKIQVSKEFEESTVSKILDLVENASSRKSQSEKFISKFAKYYTPIVVMIAILLVAIPPFVIKDFVLEEWLYKAFSFLVVSCPCALVISIPLSFFGGIGASSKIGVLIKGSNYLEALAHTEIVVCDKTGTLTEGSFRVQKVNAVGYSEEELLRYATMAEYYSNHPISLSLKNAYSKDISEKSITKTQEISGKGVFSIIDKREVLVGNEKLMDEYHISYSRTEEVGTIVYVAIDHIFAGTIVITDRIKEDSYHAIQELRKNRVQKIVMLTGDRQDISKKVAEELDLEEYHAELLPQNKVEYVEKLMNQKSANGKLLFVGDGINDAPVLALSDIGVAMGGLGSDAAIEAADVVIMTDQISKIASSIQIARKTMKIVRQNILFAIFIKVAVLLLSVLGLATMWAAVFADVGVSVLAILNALRILRVKSVL